VIAPESLRARMVAHQLAMRGIRDARVLTAMASVPRERFVPAEFRSAAYEDRALPIAFGQTISQPYMVALACNLAAIPPDGTVLDVGTGSGYQAAVLAELAASVVTIERIPELAHSAKATLDALGYGDRVEVVVGDGSVGWPARAPYDAILVAAAAPSVPEALARQVVIGGRVLLPVGPRGGKQWLTIVERVDETSFTQREWEPCVYVPLVGRGGFADE
jgi:protein-L-isoaspartate(D-aspartate) O-methyltransferase